MRVGILRGDLPGPLFIADLEPVSKANFSVDPVGQTRYLSRPTTAGVATALATAPASIASTANITFSLTVNGSNNVLRLKVGTGSFVVATIASAAYANVTTLLAAVNLALVAAGLPITAEQSTTNVRIRFKTTGAANTGPGAIITLDTNGNGSIANASLGFSASGATHTVPTAATVITAALPVGGPLDVSSATLIATVSPALSATDIVKVADAIAPQFSETEIAVKSYQVGSLSKLRASSFTPDANRLPVITPGAAITIVQDDGSTAFSSSTLAPVPTISGAAVGGGNLTISGTGLGNSEFISAVKVKVTKVATGVSQVALQRKIVAAGGTISATSLVIPITSQIPGTTATDKVQVEYLGLVSNIFTAT